MQIDAGSAAVIKIAHALQNCRGKRPHSMIILEMLFWGIACLFILAWAVYPLCMLSLARKPGPSPQTGRQTPAQPPEFPGCSIILPVFNGGAQIREKLGDLLAQDLPAAQLEIIVVSDGSTDDTLDKARNFHDDRIRAFEHSSRQGKSAAQNLGVSKARHEILVFTDLESRMAPDCLHTVLPYFDDPAVGCVGTNVMFQKPDWDDSGIQAAYARLENRIRISEAARGVLISLFGSVFAVRRACFQPLDPDTGDDFIIPLDCALQGCRTAFAEQARVCDAWSADTLLDEIKVRRRLTSRNLLGLWRRKMLLNPFRFPGLAFVLFAHKILRWFSPLLLILLFGLSCLLAFEHPVYLVLLAAQLCLYALCTAGLLLPGLRSRLPGLAAVCTFMAAQAGMGWGLLDTLRRGRIYSY